MMSLRFILSLLSIAPMVGASAGVSAQERVDVELVIAVDVSDSMGWSELRQQRAGYVAAFRAPQVISAIREGRYGRVAVTYVEWAREDLKRVVAPWTIIGDKAASYAFADTLEAARIANMRRTSISGAIGFGVAELAGNGIDGERRVIDISGDGPNNQGGPVTEARDAAAEAGVTVNGLPLLIQPWYPGIALGAPGLDLYYQQCVIGGPGAFVVPVRSWEEFPNAVRHKLIVELAGFGPETAKVVRAQLQIDPEVDCLIGEKADAAIKNKVR